MNPLYGFPVSRPLKLSMGHILLDWKLARLTGLFSPSRGRDPRRLVLKLRKRNVIGSIVLGIGLGSVILGLVDSNIVRIVIGLLLMVTGMSVLFSRSDREAGRHTRRLFEKFVTREVSAARLSKEISSPSTIKTQASR